MNRILTTLVFMMSVTLALHAQVGIGTTSPDASAALDISANDKGLLIPRMTTAQRTGISSPANSLMVFDTDTNSYWSYVNSAWVEDKPGEGKFVTGAAADIAYYPDRVGIGLDAFSQVHKLYVQGIKTTDQTNTAVSVNSIYDGSGTSIGTYGIVATARNNSTGTMSFSVGSQGVLENSSGGTIGTGAGSLGKISNNGNMSIAVGSWPQISNQGNMNYVAGVISSLANTTGSVNLARGLDVGVSNESGGTMTQPSLASFYFTNDGTITGDGYGLYIGGQGSGSVVGNSYALYLDTPFLNVTGNAFALYSANLNNSYIAGNVGFGNVDPQQKVHINGVMRLQPQASAPTGDLGDLYVNSDGTLFFHNGTEWKAVVLAP